MTYTPEQVRYLLTRWPLVQLDLKQYEVERTNIMRRGGGSILLTEGRRKQPGDATLRKTVQLEDLDRYYAEHLIFVQCVEDLLERLPEKHKKAFQLYYPKDGFPVCDIWTLAKESGLDMIDAQQAIDEALVTLTGLLNRAIKKRPRGGVR